MCVPTEGFGDRKPQERHEIMNYIGFFTILVTDKLSDEVVMEREFRMKVGGNYELFIQHGGNENGIQLLVRPHSHNQWVDASVLSNFCRYHILMPDVIYF